MLNTDTARERVFTSDDTRKILVTWFNALQERDAYIGQRRINGRAWRAELRRATAPYGVMVYEGYHTLRGLLERVMPLNHVDSLALAVFVCAAAHADKNTSGRSFAAQLGENIKGRACLSALRFDRLQDTREPAEFCRQLVRAVKLRGKEGVNIVSLADGIFLWMREWQAREEHQPECSDPFSRNRIRWASEYMKAGN
ncbi:type I-E CRISPR-associated protein Cse2/CasB [Enterobacteriaceae bacterium YMB-R22]|jgi:CRISPR system Cascade subunit CasB|uniref:type I-E CRISPR-associated protein Cse2/CasB n=1 Tax=Tenebrionicola larvae TaxID=2815733 RepID=UPI0020110864|nr:type I-E CRISPR-associated protein Cse2/CasB [Tenebrionicola larvae]MBV4411658.1 type I-E CRISPR-associated protein Cse2/CasB [Tenebrionicola larvae]